MTRDLLLLAVSKNLIIFDSVFDSKEPPSGKPGELLFALMCYYSSVWNKEELLTILVPDNSAADVAVYDGLEIGQLDSSFEQLYLEQGASFPNGRTRLVVGLSKTNIVLGCF